jgi:hypothetical protein
MAGRGSAGVSGESARRGEYEIAARASADRQRKLGRREVGNQRQRQQCESRHHSDSREPGAGEQGGHRPDSGGHAKGMSEVRQHGDLPHFVHRPRRPA